MSRIFASDIDSFFVISKIFKASSSAQCSRTSGRAASGRPTRTTFTPSCTRPSTMLSTAMLLSEAQSTRPFLASAQALRMRQATVVLPVPGGPCTNVKQRNAASFKARRWLAFKSLTLCTLAILLPAPTLDAFLVLPKSTSRTPSVGLCLPARPTLLRRSLSFVQLPSSVDGAEQRCTAVRVRVNCCRLANESTLYCLPEPVVPGGTATRGRKMRGAATTTSHSVMCPPSIGRILTQSPTKMPRP
mmetsp:Transcript_114225/g.201552  ORF Transcript_114225/g.201552 Transcript_114225/m.201552 type:complete len:245 (-) Transcript_114225:67-801(-)